MIIDTDNNYRIAHVEWRCRRHPGVVSSVCDRCYCGERLSPVVPTRLELIDDAEWMRMLDARNTRERGRTKARAEDESGGLNA